MMANNCDSACKATGQGSHQALASIDLCRQLAQAAAGSPPLPATFCRLLPAAMAFSCAATLFMCDLLQQGINEQAGGLRRRRARLQHGGDGCNLQRSQTHAGRGLA